MILQREMHLLMLVIGSLICEIIYAQNNRNQHYYKGVECAIEGKFIEAKLEFEKALKTNPLNISAKHSLEAIKKALSKKINALTVIYLFKGISYSNKGSHDKAIQMFSIAIEISPEYADAYFDRGNSYYSKGRINLAIRDYTNTLKINPKYARAYNNRGIAYVHKDQIGRAIREFTKALAINPKSAAAYNNRGIAYRIKGKYNRAILEFTKALDINELATLTRTLNFI